MIRAKIRNAKKTKTIRVRGKNDDHHRDLFSTLASENHGVLEIYHVLGNGQLPCQGLENDHEVESDHGLGNDHVVV
jgi:hypothetical protein